MFYEGEKQLHQDHCNLRVNINQPSRRHIYVRKIQVLNGGKFRFHTRYQYHPWMEGSWIFFSFALHKE